MVRLFFSLALLFSFSYAVASDEEVIVIDDSPNIVISGTSSHNRMGKKYEIFAEPYGIGPLPGRNIGAGAGFFLGRNEVIGLRYSKIQNGVSCSGFFQCGDSGSSIGVSYQRFFGNSFYVGAEISQRETHYEERSTSLFDTYDLSFDGSSTVAFAFIGNQWQWENFTLGVDWVGFGVPIASSVRNERSQGSGAASILDQKKREYVSGNVYVVGRVLFGASF